MRQTLRVNTRPWLHLFVFCLGVLFCSSAAAKKPDWIQGRSKKYPEHVYVIGVGVAGDLDGARSNARAEISRVFESRIQQTTDETLTEASKSLGKKRGPAEGRQDVEMRTRVSTDSLLRGVEIAQTWYDKKAKKHYALAVLNKSKTRAGLSTEIADREAAMNLHLARGKEMSSPVEKARHFKKALNAWEERDALVLRRRVVDPAASADFLANPVVPEIESALNDALYRIQFFVEAEPAGPESRLKESVTEKITLMGFRVIDGTAAVVSSEDPTLLARCKLFIEPFDRGNPTWKFFRWHGSFELRDSRSGGKVLASAAPSGSEGHPNEVTARAKTRIIGEQALAEEARKQISRYLFGE